jgi:hypothetical protein
LTDGFEATGSAVLEAESIEAMIDAGYAAPALARIESKLVVGRWRSSWLIRRARARLAIGDESSAHEDLRAAIEEIDERLRPDRPDLNLLIDRGVAHALLGNRVAALADLKTAREHGRSGANLERLASAVELFSGASNNRVNVTAPIPNAK